MSRAPSSTIANSASSVVGGWRVLAVAGILTLAAVGAYWNSFNVPFLLDDSLSISDNPSIRHLGRIGDVLAPPTTALTAARPLLNLSFALNYAGGGLSVRGYHAVNLLIHICAGLALFGIVRRTLLLPGLCHRYGEAALPLAAFAALLWTLHPLQTESVTYISQRAESLMGLFYLLTLYGFIRAGSSRSSDMGGTPMPRLPAVAGGTGVPPVGWQRAEVRRWLGLSVIACVCGMATKQIMVTAPVLVLLYDRAFVSGSFGSALANRRWYYASLAATWLLLGFLMHQSSLAAVSVGLQTDVSWPTYGLTELRVVTGYLKLALWPHPLVFDYGREILVTDPLAVAPYALIIVALLTSVVIAWRRSPMAGFLGCWFFLILAPTSTVVPIAAQPMAESRMYLPLAAVIVLVALWSYTLARRRVFVISGIVVVGLGLLAFQRNCDYRSELSIWEDTVARNPHTSRGHCNLGKVLAEMPERLPDAIAHYEAALCLRPDYADAHSNLGNALTKVPGRLADAIAHFEEALRLKPGFAEAHNNLAIALEKVPGRLPDAIAHYEKALRLKPDYAEAHSNFAMALVEMPGRLPEAITHYEAALRLRPDLAEVHFNLGVALAKVPGRSADAIAHYEEVLRSNPAHADAHNNLAIALAKMPGRLPDAVAHYEAALRLRPDYAEAHNNLGRALTELPGRLPDAIAHYEAALRLKPDFAEAHNNLAIILAELPGRLPDAIAHCEAALRLKPDFAEAHNNLAIALAKMPGQLGAAVAHHEEALRLRPGYAEAHYNFAITLAKIPGRLSEAIAHNEEAVRLKPGFIEARSNLAGAYAAAGRLEDAISQLEIAAQLNPGSRAIRDNLEKLKATRKQ
jgi:tetratricopeptide (TPR) repeat protein